MPTFPTLTYSCSFPIGEEREDATIRPGFESGYEHTRPRFTRSRKTFSIKYQNMIAADKATLETFVDTVREGADSFTWTHPQTAVAYTVRFNPIPKFELVSVNLWNCEFGVKTV
jgi:phage-related protein